MSKLIILGGANCQLSAFHKARELGIQTALFDMRGDAPAAKLADEFFQASTFDVSACVDAARLSRADGVMTIGTDQPVFTAAKIANELNLPSLLTPEIALSVTNKGIMKQILRDAKIPTAQYQIVDSKSLTALEIEGELVIKPLDNQGQKGVFRCENRAELGNLFEKTLSYSRSERVLVEEFYPSRELTVSAWVHEGSAQILTVTDRVTYEHPRHIGVCAAHRYPSLWAQGCEALIDDMIAQITCAFQIPAGPLYIQLLLGERGLIVNELACRIGGAFEDYFIPFITSFDILGAVMDAALGKSVDPPPTFNPSGKCVRVLMPYAAPGTLAKIAPINSILSMPFVRTAGYNFNIGDSLPAFENSGARLAHAVIFAESKQEMARNLDEFYEQFYAHNEKDDNMLLPMPWGEAGGRP